MARTKSNYVLEGTSLQSDNILSLLLRNSDDDDDQEAKKLGCGGRSLLYFHPSLLREKDTKTTIPSLASQSAGRPAGLSAQSVGIANDLCAKKACPLSSLGKLSTFVSCYTLFKSKPT